MYFGPSISVGRRGVSYGDSDAQAFIAATGLTGTTEVNAVNNLVANLKTYGLWSKMKAIYPFVSDTYNMFSYTEDFTNGYYGKTSLSVTANTTTAPNGTTTADTVTVTGTSDNLLRAGYGASSFDSNVYQTTSIYVKKGNARWFKIRNIYASDGVGNAWFDLDNGILGTIGSGQTATITSVGNGWYRLTLTAYKPTGATNIVDFSVTANNGSNQGNVNDFTYIWGSQVQVSATATDYQPIATTPANRFVSQFKYNLKDARDLDAAFRLAFNGTWTYSKQGATPNGVNGYANTYLNASTNIALNSMHFSNYLPNFTPEIKCQIGAYNPTGVLGTYAFYNYPTLGALIRLNSSNNVFANPTLTAQGFYLSTRTGATASKLYVNKATIESSSFPSDTAPAFNIYIGARNEAGTANAFSSLRQSFSTIGDGLTDTEASNLYTSVQLFQQELARYVGVPIVSDANAQAFLDAAVITDQTQANAVNTLVTDLKTYGLWTKMKAIYPFVGGTATTHKWNLKDPRDLDAAYRLAFSGAWTHSSTGALPNGANAYADTYFIPNNALTLNSSHLGFYSRTNSTTGVDDFSAVIVGDLADMRIIINEANVLKADMNSYLERITGTNTSSTGLYQVSRISSTSLKVYKNNTIFGTNTATNTGTLPAISMYLSAAHRGTSAINYSNRECAFATLGDGLSDTEAANLYTAVNKFQTSLSRNV